MKRGSMTIAILFCFLLCAPLYGEIKPFLTTSLKAMVRDHQDEPWLLVIWSIDCAPCYEELDLIAKFMAENSHVAIELISTDSLSDKPYVSRVLRISGLSKSWLYGDSNEEELQNIIDPEWRGEQPRSYFYSADGSRVGMSGVVNETLLKSWFGSGNRECDSLH